MWGSIIGRSALNSSSVICCTRQFFQWCHGASCSDALLTKKTACASFSQKNILTMLVGPTRESRLLRQKSSQPRSRAKPVSAIVFQKRGHSGGLACLVAYRPAPSLLRQKMKGVPRLTTLSPPRVLLPAESTSLRLPLTFGEGIC